ncbi:MULTISPECIES: urease subunit beta [unclassified Streptomyces]|uniref:urease subunit beta n=1 Tax=unclassified Streptomyces TaxID=2593676 RepID=UPI000DC77DFE|nr:MULTISPECIES: urease subunit beta [unclassified Streptomyces]AWZ08100.1 urease subunit beta [Streptomyces sp. ICC4]AWZ15881.1 urease subunit beta [Streptomyces sp. ICC1]
MSGGAKYLYGEGTVEINSGRRKAKVTVSNTGDRAVQVGSHYHFFEVNRALDFDRNAAYGMHLDLPSGTGVRFEPGDTREVELTAYSGHGRIIGFSSLTDGGLGSTDTRIRALRRAVELGFKGARIEDVHAEPAPRAAGAGDGDGSKTGSGSGSGSGKKSKSHKKGDK